MGGNLMFSLLFNVTLNVTLSVNYCCILDQRFFAWTRYMQHADQYL